MSNQSADVTIRDNAVASRYELLLDGQRVGVVDYSLDDGVMVLPHVEVAPALRGKGYSAPFLDAVLAEVRARGLKIRPLCSYARAHVVDRPELHDLLA